MSKQYEKELLSGGDPNEEVAKKASATDAQILVDREKEVRSQVEAEIQRKLTKASNFFAGKLTKALGLRFAPDLRFHLDQSQQRLDEVQQDARQHLEQFYQRERELEQ